MDKIKKINLDDNLNLTLIKNEKFKSNFVGVYIERVLDREEVSKNALIPAIISSGSMKYPTTREIQNKLEFFYGARMSANVVKKSEKQIIQFKMLGINEKFVDEKILKDMIEFFAEIITNPFVENRGFKKDYLDLEKLNLQDKINSVINDKRTYAHKKSIELMCEDERYSIDNLGYIEDIDKINEKDLYEHYKNILRTSPIEIVVEGDFNFDETVEIIKKNFHFERKNIIEIPREEFKTNVKEVRTFDEHMDINQGKLVIGYRANVDYTDERKYCALSVANCVFGGGPHSKLFNNVREKESLCYYIFSSLEKFKSLMFVSSGIEFKDYDKAVKLITQQLEDVKNGNITNEEIENSKKAIINESKMIVDNVGGMAEFCFTQSISKTNYTLEQLMKTIDEITLDEIVDAIKDIQLDTIYFLRD